MAQNRSFSILALIFSSFAAFSAAGCSSSSSNDTTTCAPDSTVDCTASGTVGYSCSGTDVPTDSDPSLNCSADTGAGTFCCDTGAGGAAGSAGAAGAAGSTSAGECVFDPTVDAQCTTDSAGYSCTDGAIPTDGDPTLNCSDDVGTGEFCCSTTVAGATCDVDPTLDCAQGDGYSCSGSDNPDQDFDGITCSADQGTGTFCCVVSGDIGAGGSGGAGGSSSSGSCVFDPTVDAQCTGTSAGYSCTGTDLPSDSDSSLNCSDDVGTGEFCCDNASATCDVDPTLSCDAGDGYSCSGSDTPDQDFSGITCSADQGTGTFCCVVN